MSHYGHTYGAAAAFVDVPFDDQPSPPGIFLEPDHFDHDEENAVDLEYLGYEYDPEHVDVDADADADVDVDHSEDGLGDAVYDQDQHIDIDPDPADDSSPPGSPSPPVSPWYDGPSDLDRSGSEGGGVHEERDEFDEDGDAVLQYLQRFVRVYGNPESEDDLDHLPQPDIDVPDSPEYYNVYDPDHARERSSSPDHSVVTIDDDDDDDDDDDTQSDSLGGAASRPPDGTDDDDNRSTLSPSPPAYLHHDESAANSRSSSPRSDLVNIVSDDADVDLASRLSRWSAQRSAPASASASTSASGSGSAASSLYQGSRPGPRGPHHRQPLHRPSEHWDPGFNFISNNHNNNHQPPRPSPRLSSLTPVIHPNRRLPRQSPQIQSPPNLRSSTSDPSDSSADELATPQPPRRRRRLGIERTRRPIFANIQPLSSSDEEDDNSSSSIGAPLPDLSDSSDGEPISRHRLRQFSVSVDQDEDEASDSSEGSPPGNGSLSGSEEEQHDYMSQSDLEEEFVQNNRSQSGGSQAGGPAEGHHSLDNLFVNVEPDLLEDLLLQGVERHQQARAESLQAWEARAPVDEDEEEEVALLARQRQRGRDRLRREVRQQQDQEAAARERRRRAARNPFLDSDLEQQSDADMDGDDELVEVVFDRQLDGPPAPPLQRQPRHQQRQRSNRQNNNRAHHVELIDLTEEPDSPVQNHAFQNHNIDHHHHQQQQQQYHRPFHHRRMPQNGQPPSLARSDGSVLGGQRGPAVIDLTNDEPEFEAAVVDDDNDDLFVAQNLDDFLDHIPADRRLPVPGPPHQDRRRSVEFLGFAARHLRDLGGQYLPGLLAALPRIPRGIANDIAIIGREQGLAMNPNPLADNPPDFNYQANGFGGRPPPPKPEFDAPPPARPGFTRNTGVDPETGEELVIVCASCDSELKYDDDDDDGPRPAKRPRNKKDREEHHFWAVKACGHVYCKSCYDNRKKTKGKEYAELDMHFRVEQSVTAKSAKIFCAVDNCDSDVSQNNSWVGIFM